MSRWNEWLLTPEMADQFTFPAGARIFEFSDSYSNTGWKPFNKSGQRQLREIFDRSKYYEFPFSHEINCFGWKYNVRFDLFRRNPDDFVNAPDDAIGYQFGLLASIRKRWIRLTTFRAAARR